MNERISTVRHKGSIVTPQKQKSADVFASGLLSGESDGQQIAVCFQRAIRLMGQHALGQHLAELYALLVEAVQVPAESLEHNLILKVSQQRAKRFRGKLFADDDAGGAAAFKTLVGVFILLAAGKGHDLGCNICAQLLLAGAALDIHIHARLVPAEAYKLQRHNVCTLVQELIEGVLPVGAGFTEDNGAGRVVDRLAKAVDMLAVGFHIELLQMCREAAERLGIRQHRSGRVAQNVAFVHADERIEHGGIFQEFGFLRRQIRLMRAVKKSGKHRRSEGQRQHHTAYTGSGGIASTDIIVHEESREIITGLCERGCLTRDSNHMLCGVQPGVSERILYEGFVGQGLQRSAGFRHQHKYGVPHVNGLEHARRVIGVNIADEVLDFIASQVTESVRELEGIMVALLAHATMLDQDITIELARSVIGNTVKVNQRQLTFELIAETVADYYNLSTDLIYGKSRKREISDARQLVMYLAKKEAQMSSPSIGAKLDRTHATVLHACIQIEQRMSIEKDFSREVQDVTARLMQ